MDAWTDLSNRLADPLCAQNDLSMALANADDAQTACPKAIAATLKNNLAQVAELTSDTLIVDLASRLQRRLGRTSQPSAGRETVERSAQNADLDDSDVDWWRDFVPAAVTKLPPRSSKSEGRRPTGTEPEHLTTVRPEVQADGGKESPSGPSAKRTKREDSAVELETFTPLRTQREDSAADSDLETFAPLRTRSSTASAWEPGRQCGALLRRGQLSLISRLPGWALDLWRQFRSLPATELRLAIEALRGLARLLEDVLRETRQAEQAPASAASSSRAASA